MDDIGDLYEATRARCSATVRAGADRLSTIVPATPDWTVHDVVAHVVGLCADLNALRFPDTTSDPGGNGWTAAQVAARRGLPLEALLAEWEREGPVFAEGLRAFGYEFGAHFVADLHCHHQDVRRAFGLSADDDTATVEAGLHHYLAFVDETLRGSGWGSLRVVASGHEQVVGEGPVRATVEGDGFVLLRCLSARRTRTQFRALGWDGEADAAIATIEGGFAGNYAFPTEEVER